MGEMADMLLEDMDWEYDEDDWMFHINPRNPSLWKTKEGKIIKVKEMTDSHLFNALNFCRRNGISDSEKVLEKEMESRAKKQLEKDMLKDPILHAFMAGYRAGSSEAYPSYGICMETSKEQAWQDYKKSKKK